MRRLRTIVGICLIWVKILVLGEGTKELKPTASDKGNLLLLKGYSKFGMVGASAAEQIKLTVATSGEKVYFGFNNKNGKDGAGLNSDQGAFVPNLTFRILAPSGAVVYSGTMPSLGQEGHIADWTQASSGPRELGNATGYDALQFTAQEVGDYVIEFDPISQGVDRLNIHLFDVTVVDASNKVQLGRLHSQGWQISTESYTNAFNGKVYPYDQGNTLYEVNFNGIQPWVFVINFNGHGTANTGDFLADRQSKIGNHTFGTHEVFLNPPEAQLFPTQKRVANLDVTVSKADCMSADFCINFSTNSPGELEGFIDFNQNGIIDVAMGEVAFYKHITVAGQECIQWDGKDAFGNLISATDFQVRARFGTGVMHLPLYDVEHNRNGYQIKTISPDNVSDPVIFWDDSQLVDGTAIDGIYNIYGCNSAVAGCHKWSNRGSINDNTALDKQETINTWWYSSMDVEAKIFSFPKKQQVRLSLHPTALVHKDTTVCRGEYLSFYIYNDGKDHFNEQLFDYVWIYNSIALSEYTRTQIQQINQGSLMVVKATDKQYPSCVSYDTLRINVVDPATVQVTTSAPSCGMSNGSISVQMHAGQLHPSLHWAHDANETALSLNHMPKGTYSFTVVDPDYPTCVTDSSVVLVENGGIIIDSVKATELSCNVTQGQAQIWMQDLGRNYEYSWDGGTFVSNSLMTGLAAGNHKVLVREVNTACTDAKTFALLKKPEPITLSVAPELCHNAHGSIKIALPTNHYDIFLQGVKMSASTLSGLNAGVYQLSAVHQSNNTCRLDTTVTIENSNVSKVLADFSYTMTEASETALNVLFKNESKHYQSSLWTFSDGQQSTQEHPQHPFEKATLQTATLTVKDSNGCSSTIQRQWLISLSPESQGNCGIALPNVFTPNGDAVNDNIGILGYAPKVELLIFNRWGEVIFRTQEIPQRWDGGYRGEGSPIGVYPYILTWECPNAQGIMMEHKKVGDITLLR